MQFFQLWFCANCALFLLSCVQSEQIYAQKKRIHNAKESLSLSGFDSLLQTCAKGKAFDMQSCDTNLVHSAIKEFAQELSKAKNDKLAMLCSYGNLYHAWLLIALSRKPHLVHIGNCPDFLCKDTLILQKDTINLASIKARILSMAESLSLPVWFSLWNGTVSGANPPRKSWKKNSIVKTLQASAKAYFAHKEQEYSLDITMNILRISSQYILDRLGSLECSKEQSLSILKSVTNYLPESMAAYIALHKNQIIVKPIMVSDRISVAW